MMWILIVYGLSYQHMMANEGRPEITSVSYIKSFDAEADCLATGIQITEPNKQPPLPTMTFKCVKER